MCEGEYNNSNRGVCEPPSEGLKMSLLKLNQVKEITQLSRSSIYRLISEDKFPKQIKLSERASRWIESEVMEFINQKMVERDGK